MDGFPEERRNIKLVRLFSWHWQILFWKRPRGGKSSWWSHSSTERSFYNILEINSKCSILGTTVRSGGTWIGILADEVVCNHDLRNNTWRFHWSCGIRWWRSSTFRTTWNSKATVQGNVEQELAMPTAAAFHFWPKRTEPLRTKAEKRGTYLKFKTVRNTSLRWTNHQATWSSLFPQCDEIHTDDVDVTTSTFPSEDANNQIIERIKVGSKKIFVFTKIRWRKAWNSVKSPLKPPKTWPTLSSSNWGLLKFINVPHADTPYLRRQFFAHVSSLSDRTRRWYNVLGQLFTFSKHLLSARLQFLQEVRSMVINYGSYLLRKQNVCELSFRRPEY